MFCLEVLMGSIIVSYPLSKLITFVSEEDDLDFCIG